MPKKIDHTPLEVATYNQVYHTSLNDKPKTMFGPDVSKREN